MKSQEMNLNSEVSNFLDNLDHPLRQEIELVRLTIMNAYSRLSETIKWNGPNYSVDNADRITMKIQPPKQIQLIFHRGAKVQQQPAGRIIQDKTGLLVWKENDRAIVTLRDLADIKNKKAALAHIVKAWIHATS